MQQSNNTKSIDYNNKLIDTKNHNNKNDNS